MAAQLGEKRTEAHLVKTGPRHALVLCLVENQFKTSIGTPFYGTHDIVTATLMPHMELNYQATSSDA